MKTTHNAQGIAVPVRFRLITLGILVTLSASGQNTFPPTGKVGIGTTQPEERATLQVHGQEILSTGDLSGFRFRTRKKPELGQNDWTWYADENNIANFWTEFGGELGQDLIKITQQGNVGIGLGEDNPGEHSRFEVRHNRVSIAKFKNNAPEGQDRTALIDIENGINTMWRMGVGGPGNFVGLPQGQFYLERFGADATGVVALTVSTDGKVGIGTNEPGSARLAVNGKIGATEIEVTAPGVGWPDYVFGKGYQLLPLPALERYIQANQHLPDVPSAAQVTRTGINVAEMDALLLKKVEELTLHLIDQHKQLEALQQQNRSLRQQLEKLENR